jgi:UDP-glucose 4-epimerase
LVTGGGGFIGHHLTRQLVTEGFDVRVLDNFATGQRERLQDIDISIVEGDVRSYERAHTAVRGVHTVFHLAALPSVPRSVADPLTTNSVNIDGTLNVLLASRDEGVQRVVFASSSSVYGANPALPKREDHQPLPLSPYGVSKLAAEQYCRAFHRVYGLEAVSLRLFNVFGPGQDPLSQYAAVVPRFIDALKQGRPPVVYGDGSQTRDFTYVADVVDAFFRAAKASHVAGEVLNICAGAETTILQLIDVLTDLLETSVEPQFAPARLGEIARSAGDRSKAERELGWIPRWSLRRALREWLEEDSLLPTA